MTLGNIVLAVTNPPSIFNFYHSVETAGADLARANGGEYKHFRNGQQYEVMNYEDYKVAEKRFYLDRPDSEITKEKFHEMLNVLPPKHWTNSGGFESFLMIEHYSGPFTEQYFRRGDRYFVRLVDATDKTTWAAREVR